MIYTVVPDQSAVSLRFLKGEADLQEIVRPRGIDRFKQESARGSFQFMDLGLASEQDNMTFNQNTNSNPETRKSLR